MVHISDHALVYVILRASLPTSRSQKIHFRSLKNFNIDNFCSDLNDAPIITVMNCFEDVDDITFAFQSLYTAILDEHAPLKSVHVQGNQVPFMNESWRKAIRHRNHLWRMFTRDRTDANYAAYKSQRNICTSLRRKAIKEYFRKKSDEINQDPRQFWATYRPFLHSRRAYKSNDIILMEGKEIVTDKTSIAETFNDYFVNIANGIKMPESNEYGRDFSNHPSVVAIEQSRPPLWSQMTNFSFSPCNSMAIEQILRDLKTNKSPGYDNITPKLLKFSAKFISPPLSMIFNTAIAQCKYPSVWKKCQITPLPKGSGDEMDKTLFRPVTVLPALNNVFERVLAVQLTPYFQNGILGDFLCAYRKNHTTLLHLVEDWKQSRDRGELVAMVAMDLSKAFDSLPHSLLVRKLQAYGVDEQSCLLMHDYLQGRLQQVKVGDAVSSWEFNRRGVPQGSVLGPLLFNVFLNDLSYFITRVKLNAYADH